jgi:hypothetical protein
VFLADLAREVRGSLRERGSPGSGSGRRTRRFTPGSRGGSIPPAGEEAAADRRSAEELKRRLDDTRERLKQEARALPPDPE